MQAYSINNMHPVFSMRDQATMVLTAALGHVWDLIKVAPQPEESLETIYVWVEDWDKTRNFCTEVLGAIAITDLQHPVEQRQIHINDIFEDYQERVELRVQLEAERLTREPSMCMCRQATTAIGEGQGCMPSNTGAGESSRGTGGQVRQQMDSTGKGKGKEKATDEVNKLENNEGNCPPNPDPLKTGTPAPKANLPCWECAKHKNAGSGETAAGPSHKQTKPTGLLDDPPTPNISAQDLSKVPPVEETLLVTNLGDTTMHEALAECIQLLENRADDKEFELTQIHQMLGLLAICVFGYFEQNYH
ncbi:hypothetical protein F5J12DRAFT_778606 [Pisolithus orientalis]|uniref:uncharacterized protein n=1 Tax=Pisolithus orientalis TaxID=936130 RepID=UPI002224C464|nr:uncharacterized protein F5J12DRAFT_778606 [Pisolithus orientalis]KAI6035021.1 hypothetical protein F5J12DRAFT_778606 [Pisolithus orientalis]